MNFIISRIVEEDIGLSFRPQQGRVTYYEYIHGYPYLLGEYEKFPSPSGVNHYEL